MSSTYGTIPIVFICFCQILAFLIVSCAAPGPVGLIEPPTYTGPARTFTAPFTSVDEFAGFYIVPQNSYGSNHELSTEQFRDAPSAHKAWVVAANDADNQGGHGYLPHRAYPTVNFQRTPGGIYRTPCLVTLYVWWDMALADRHPQIDDWMSFVTLTPDASDRWVRTVLVNIEHDGYIHLMHVPDQGQYVCLFQKTDLPFPLRAWVRLDVYVDFNAAAGRAVVWQDRTKVSEALVNGGAGGLAQAHFGLYASAAVSAGVVFNDKLRIAEVTDLAEAQTLVDDAW